MLGAYGEVGGDKQVGDVADNQAGEIGVETGAAVGADNAGVARFAQLRMQVWETSMKGKNKRRPPGSVDKLRSEKANRGLRDSIAA